METHNVPQDANKAVKLNLGAGNTTVPGFKNWDLKQGKQAFPLALPDGSVDELYASHLLEHFPRAQSLAVLREWVRVLKPGGRIRIAVPDMDKIVSSYSRKDKITVQTPDGQEKIIDAPWEAWLFGGQTDPFDIHYTGWNQNKLGRAMAAVGLVDVAPWESESLDCSRLPISTNLQGYKRLPAGDKPEPPQVEDESPAPEEVERLHKFVDKVLNGSAPEQPQPEGEDAVIVPFAPASQEPEAPVAETAKALDRENAGAVNRKRLLLTSYPDVAPLNPASASPAPEPSSLSIAAVTSMPRFGPSQMLKSLYDSLPGIVGNVMHGLGPLWGQALERSMEDAIEQWNPDLLLVMDFDGVFTADDLRELIRLMQANPSVAALAAHQWNRGRSRPLWTLEGRSWDGPDPVRAEELDGDIFEVSTANFGLTLLRTSVLKTLPHPWFLSQPNGENRWREGKVDDDIYFWQKLRAAGHRVFIAPKVVIGHLELSIRWPGRNLDTVWQHTSDYNNHGKPKTAFGAAT